MRFGDYTMNPNFEIKPVAEMPTEPAMPPTRSKMASYPIIDPNAEELAKALFERIIPGFTVENEHHRRTPARWVKAMKELCDAEEFDFTTFASKSDDMVVVGPTPFYTLCSHHLLPFHGWAFVGYVPNGRIAGLSKLPRAVQYVSKGTWAQEELTAAIAGYLESKLDPRGVAVVLEAEHMCMSMRGVKVDGAVTTTAAMKGVFGDHGRTAKAEFLEWIAPRRTS
jgi:GTP cyclohydrolase IA